jgi:hypothetical protein
MPLTSYEKIWGSRNSVTIFIQPREGVDYEASLEEARVTTDAVGWRPPFVPLRSPGRFPVAWSSYRPAAES